MISKNDKWKRKLVFLQVRQVQQVIQKCLKNHNSLVIIIKMNDVLKFQLNITVELQGKFRLLVFPLSDTKVEIQLFDSK